MLAYCFQICFQTPQGESVFSVEDSQSCLITHTIQVDLPSHFPQQIPALLPFLSILLNYLTFKNYIRNWRYISQSQHYCLAPTLKPLPECGLVVLWVSATMAFSQSLYQNPRLSPRLFSFLESSPATLSHTSHLRPRSLLHRSLSFPASFRSCYYIPSKARVLFLLKYGFYLCIFMFD